MSKADDLFISMCRRVLDEGFSTEGQQVRARWADTNEPAHTKKVFGVINRYDLSEEFPALTLRPVPFKTCVDELLWIWQKKSNNIKDLKGHIWDAWADENGSIGKAYGYQMQKKYIFKGGEMDQVDNVLWCLKNDRYSRRILTNLFNFEDLHEMALEPCAYSMTFNVVGNKLNAILNQRSQDILAANAWNVCQYAVLVHMMAQVSGLKAGEFVHVVADAHIYDRHIPLVRELLTAKPLPAPTFVMDPSVTDFYDFTPDSFRLENYQYNAFDHKIPVAI